jgi:hypothetical protein
MPLGIRYGSQLCRNAVRCFEPTVAVRDSEGKQMAGTMMVVYYTMPLGMGHDNLIAYLTAGIYDVCTPIPAISPYLRHGCIAGYHI